jgi:hypothetical protein
MYTFDELILAQLESRTRLIASGVPYREATMIFLRNVKCGWAKLEYDTETQLAPVPSPSMKDTCTEHCCVIHGCKYGKFDCSVETRQKRQSFPCEICRGNGVV